MKTNKSPRRKREGKRGKRKNLEKVPLTSIHPSVRDSPVAGLVT